ncbi:hypothetical protein FNF31_07464 [Cafeteria roenbergensis]|uniref:C2 domain-containing protein n=1 Tax=Cafeteria roenbergensis TaxID=33653 RepID=A0A5A8C516_CAFRO|nr:hypothetical protein FNF31_07464 [Cafeteria roenbergensis]
MAMSDAPMLLAYGMRVAGLPAMDRNGKADPYLKLSAGRDSFRTKTKKATLEASWDEQFYFGKKGRKGAILSEDTLRVEVWDDDTIFDESVGVVSVPLADIRNPAAPTKTVALPIIGPKGKERGQLFMSLLFMNLPAAKGSAPGGAMAPASAGAAAAAGASAAGGSGAASDAPAAAPAAAGSIPAAAAAAAACNTLKFRVFSARGLRHKAKAYLRINAASGNASTTPGAEATEPNFAASFLAPAPSPSSSVVVSVFQKSMFRDRFVGAIALTADQFAGAQPRRQWYSLGDRDGVEGDGTRGEIEVMAAWEASMSPVGAPVPFDPATGQPRVGPPTADGQMGEVVPPEAKAESEEERAAREAEERRHSAMMRGMSLRRGDYKVMVHIHEVRQLKDEDLNASVDPCVRVEVLGKRQQTKTAWMTNAVVFDHLMYFSFEDLSPEQLERGSVTIRVMDVDRFSRDDLVGQHVLDLPFVYFREHHELHGRWLGITDPTHKRKKGLMGYVKVSVAVLGPGDRRHLWDAAEEARLEAAERAHGLESVVMMPPSIDRKVEFLVVTAHRAEDLMPMDKPQVGGLVKGGIDAYVQVDFAGNPSARTPWVARKGKHDTALNVSWTSKNQLWIPVMVPTMTTGVRVAVMDYDMASSDDLVGTAHLNFRALRSKPVHRRWFNLYGGPEGIYGQEAEAMAEFPAAASHFRGRVLLSAEVVRHPRPDEVEHVHVKTASTPVFLDPSYAPASHAAGSDLAGDDDDDEAVSPPPDAGAAVVDGAHPLDPPTREYTLRALVLSGVDIPAKFNPISRTLGLGKGHEMAVEIEVGGTVLSTEANRVTGGAVWWGKQLSARVRLPADPAQVPDVFLYLRRGKAGPRVCFARWSGEELAQEEDAFDATANPCEWVPLQEDVALDALADNQQPGAVLCRLALAPSEFETVDETWEDDLARASAKGAFELRVHVYQARNLPAADSTGSADPYVRVQVDGQVMETRYKEATVSPLFYETLRFRGLALPLEREFRPPVTLQVFDRDRFTSDDFISELRMPLSDPRVLVHPFRQDGSVSLPATLKDPEWFPLTALGREDDGPQGELLLSLELVHYDDIAPGAVPAVQAPRPASIVPEMDDWHVEVLCLGMRSMQPYMGLPIANPRVDMDLGDRSKAEAVKRTSHSNFPSGSDPNFCQRILIPCRLPRREIFAPALNLSVVDRRLGGFLEPVVGTATVPLVDKIPGTPSYRPPFGSLQTENLHYRDMSQTERANPPIFPKSARQGPGKARAGRRRVATVKPNVQYRAGAEEEDMQIELDGVPIDLSAGEPDLDGAAAAASAGGGDTATSSPDLSPSAPRRHRRRRKLQAPESHSASAGAVHAAAAQQLAQAEAAAGSGQLTAAVAGEAARRAKLESTAVSRSADGPAAAAAAAAAAPVAAGAGGPGPVLAEEEAVGSSSAGGGVSVGALDLPAGAELDIGASPLLSLGAASAGAHSGIAAARAAAQVALEAEQQAIARRGGAAGSILVSNADNGSVRGVAASAGGAAAALAAAAAGVDVSFLDRHMRYADGAVTADGEPRFHAEDKAARYMSGRRVYSAGLEEALQTAPFETIDVMRGQDVGRGHIFGWRLPSTLRRVGVFKGIVRVVKDPDAEPEAGWAKILEPKEYEVRAYVLQGYGMRPMDRNRRSDCYLVGKLGDQRVSFRDSYHPRSIDPPLYKVVTFKTVLPGPSRLDLSVWDFDSVSFDDFIGRTEIDLEDRWFDPRWQALGRGFESRGRLPPKPLEERRLFSPDRWESTGALQVWVDVLDPATARDHPAVDIEPPPPRDFECRVVIWRTWGVPAHDYFTDMNDLYVRGWLEGSRAQSTDVHLRCKKGRGSFNWRMVFKTTVPCKAPILHLQMWDRDYLEVSDLIAQAELQLDQHFEAARHCNGRYMVMDRIRGAFEGTDALTGATGSRPHGMAVPGAASKKPRAARPRYGGAESAPLLGGGRGLEAVEEEDDDDDEQVEVEDGFGPLDGSGHGATDGDDASGPGGADEVSVPAVTAAVIAAELRQAHAAAQRREAARAASAPNTAGGRQQLRAQAEQRRAAAQAAAQAEFAAADSDGDGDDPTGGVAGGQGKGDAASLLARATTEAETKAEADAARSTVQQAKEAVGVPIHPHADNAAWLPLYRHYGKDDDGNKVMLDTPMYMGKVLVSVELVPVEVAESFPVGLGRAAPNEHPHLPPPAGRMRFSLNPFYLGRECLGPRIFGNCLLCLCLVGVVLAVFFGAPFIQTLATIVNSLGDPLGGIITALVVLAILIPIVYICVKYVWCPEGVGILQETASDNHTYLDLMQVQSAKADAKALGFGRGVAAAPKRPSMAQSQQHGSAAAAAGVSHASDKPALSIATPGPGRAVSGAAASAAAARPVPGARANPTGAGAAAAGDAKAASASGGPALTPAARAAMASRGSKAPYPGVKHVTNPAGGVSASGDTARMAGRRKALASASAPQVPSAEE